MGSDPLAARVERGKVWVALLERTAGRLRYVPIPRESEPT